MYKSDIVQKLYKSDIGQMLDRRLALDFFLRLAMVGPMPVNVIFMIIVIIMIIMITTIFIITSLQSVNVIIMIIMIIIIAISLCLYGRFLGHC